MFYFLADDENIILQLCASLKTAETFFCTFSTIKIRKSFKNQQTAKKTRVVLQIYKNLLGEKLLGRKKKKDISWKNRTYRSPVMNDVRWFVPLKVDANTAYIIISSEQIMRHLHFLEICSGIHHGPYLKHFITIWVPFLTPAAFPTLFGFISVCRSLHSQFSQNKIKV